jgi:hypothetical protein
MVGAVEDYLDADEDKPLSPSLPFEDSSGDFGDRMPPAGETRRPLSEEHLEPLPGGDAPRLAPLQQRPYHHELREESGDDELENEPTRAQAVGEIAAPDQPPMPRGDPSGPLVSSPLGAERFELTDRSQPPVAAAEDTGPVELIRDTLARMGSSGVIILVAVFTLLLFGIGFWAIELLGEEPQPPETPTGSIVVTTDPPADCTVSVGGKIKRLMTSGGTLGISGVDVGPHQVSLTCAGFRPFAATISVETAQVTVVEAVLKRE